MTTSATAATSRLGAVSLGLGILSALLITVVSFIALVLAAGALVTGGLALGRGSRPAAVLAGMALALGAVVLFVIEVS
jgi:hypothetical protein